VTRPGVADLIDQIGDTPLVPLRRIAAGLPVPVLAKCEHLNPGGSVKDRIARAIVDDAEARGALAPGMTLVEATAGNTGMGLALVAAARGYHLVCVMPEKMSADKRAALVALGARVVITPNAPPSSPDNFQNVAARLAAERGWFLTDQFRNPANVRVHEETTAAEILAQTGGWGAASRRCCPASASSWPTRSARAWPAGWRPGHPVPTGATRSRASAPASRPTTCTAT